MKPERLSTIQACIDAIRSAYEGLVIVRDEEYEAFDIFPESLLYGKRGNVTHVR